jgi:four helix bundle protein
MNKEDLQRRTLLFSIRIINMVGTMPETKSARLIAAYLLRASTSMGAKYRGACRPASARDFINKLKSVEEETDETLFWLELIEESNIFQPEKISELKKEANELLAIFVSSIITAKKNLKLKTKTAA